MTQDEALVILKTGANVFLTGEPGSGKTHTINQYTQYLRARGVDMAITASTGIAATHIGGMTIHSWGGIGIKSFLGKYDLDRIASSEYVVKRIRRAQVLVMDEVSMLAPETLTMVDAVCREVRQSKEAFGGLQVILVGDFFQLPPVRRYDGSGQATLIKTPTARFAFDAPVWHRANFVTCYLTEQHRQDDPEFLSVLTAIRQNAVAAKHRSQIAKRERKAESVATITPKIYSHNADVDGMNEEMLAKLKSEVKRFIMLSRGPTALVETLKKGCLSPEVLSLKLGAAVMFTKNNPKEGYVNGTLGTVQEFNPLTGQPLVRTHDGREVLVELAEWNVEENGHVRASVMQLPLRLAWAITVHKSQGMSLDEAVMDLREVFEYGQGYVALSRVRRFKGLHLLGINDRALEVHPEVLAKDIEFRASSEAARLTFGKLSAQEVQLMHKNFIVSCGGNSAVADEPAAKPTGRRRTVRGRIRARRTKLPAKKLCRDKNVGA